MSEWTRTGCVFLTALGASLLCANAVPTTPEALTKRADLVADVRVSELGISLRVPGGTLVTCLHAEINQVLKGVEEKELTVCETGIAESEPPKPQLGRRYRMYLMKGWVGTYAPFSYAGFKSLGDDALILPHATHANVLPRAPGLITVAAATNRAKIASNSSSFRGSGRCFATVLMPGLRLRTPPR